MPDPIQQAIHLLADLIVQGDCVVFLGNDLPLGYPDTAPPCNDELADELAKGLGWPDRAGRRLAEVAQAFEAAFGRQPMLDKVIRLVNDSKFRPAWLHELAAELPVNGYITTASDRMLVEALRVRQRQVNKVVTSVNLPFESSAKCSVTMLYGDAEHPSSLVVTTKDHKVLPVRLQGVLQLVGHYFTTKTVLLVGCRLEDDNLQTLYLSVKEQLGQFGRRLMAVYPGYADAPSAARNFWAGENITILDADPRVFLNELQAEVKKQQQAVEDRKAAPEPLRLLDKKPYKFLDAYTAADRDIFYGRDTDAALVWGKILSFRTMMLFGASGTGKTSLLQAAVAPRLEAAGYRVALTRVLDDPVKAVMHAVQKVRDGKAGATPLQLTGFFRGLGERERWVVLLDQFEEYFVRQVETERARFRDQVRACADDRALDVRFVFSLREDFVGHMQELRTAMPDLWVNSHRLMPLSRSEAVLAVTAPAARTGLLYEPGLVEDRLLRDLAERDGGVAPPNLQIVCQQLYQEVDEQTSTQAEALVAAWRASHPDLDVRFAVRRAVTLARYQALDGAHEILRKHLDGKLATLAGGNAQALEELREVLRALVQKTDSVSTKAALTAAEVAERADLPTTQVEEALKQLASQEVRLARVLEEGQRYELAHECLIERIQAWPESPQRVCARDIKNILREHMKLGELLSRQLLERAWEERENPRLKLSAHELELLFRSALAHSFEAVYWFRRACDGGVAADAIALEGLKSDNFRTRAAAVNALGGLGDRFTDVLLPLLADLYPQVRVAVIAALERLRPDGAWRKRLKYECYVPAGEFIMGDDRRDRVEENPAHKVYLDAYYIGKYPITNADYARYRADIKRAFNALSGAADHPVQGVSWYDAADYAAWAEMRLPTEAEWEKAASWAGDRGQKTGGREQGRKRRYPWGDEFDKSWCNMGESGIGRTTPVGKYSPRGDSPYGCADMAGNVWEWCNDAYATDAYRERAGGVAHNPAGPSYGQSKVLRGGSCLDDSDLVRCASRNGAIPDHGNGFRIARSSR